MFGLIRKIMILVMSTISAVPRNCLLLKNQECEVRKVIVNSDYMTFPYKTKVDRCIGSCIKVCIRDIVKNISVKVLDLISQKNVLRNVSFHKSCKCSCLLD